MTPEKETVYYFLERRGIYNAEVYWIGTDLEEGKRKSEMYATNDVDDYHRWDVSILVEDGRCDTLYSTRKNGDSFTVETSHMLETQYGELE